MINSFLSERLWPLLVVLFAGMLLAPSLARCADNSAQDQAQRQVTQPLNNAPMWREVRKGGGENPN